MSDPSSKPSIALALATLLLAAVAPVVAANGGGRSACGRSHLPAAVSATVALERSGADTEKEDADAAREAWDVNAPPFDTYEIALDTTTGTWMSVAVHPDGTELVFDRLGDIYTLPIEGGDGLQLLEKPNEQKDLGESAFSPDGRYLDFSQDTTPGGVFEYSKDPNGEIDTVRRIDLETGDVTTVLHGAGGAVDPTWSPDGRHLAFVRRVRFDTVLFVHDLESGEERVIRDDLDRDMQETWAIHGVYPDIAWTPDGKEIVFWSGGRLHRVDVATGAVREIPFRVRQKRTMIEAVRYPVEVAPDSFDPKMLRWVTVSPDGSRVVYQALRVWSDASGKHHEFYWDLPKVDAGHRVTHTSPPGWGNKNPPAPALTWGDAPWNPGREVWDGILGGFQIDSAKLSLADIRSEALDPLSSAAGSASIWYLNVDPTPEDLSDKSGAGHDPAWVGSERPRRFTEREIHHNRYVRGRDPAR